MTDLISEYTEYETFADDWDAPDETETRMLWHLLGELDTDEVLLELPEWLADEKVGFVDGATPTVFVGRIDRTTEKAVRVVDSAAARPLMKLAHRIHRFEVGLETGATDDAERREWLESHLHRTRREFEQRDDITGLVDEWLPKSQLVRVARRVD